jgi:hypothetical protein
VANKFATNAIFTHIMQQKDRKKHFVIYFFIVISLIVATFSNTALGSESQVSSATGKNQLVQALNAAFISVLSSGKWNEITKPYGTMVVNISDCYPTPDYAPFPQKPVGLLKKILENRQIKVGMYPASLEGSANYFLPMNNALYDAILNELVKAYNLPGPIKRIPVIVNPPSGNLLFKQLNAGVFDITDLNAAIGGASTGWPYQTKKQLRRSIARFTCTVISSGQYLQVKKDSLYQSMADLQADSNAKICAGMLSSQIATAYFPGHDIQLPTGNDLEICGQGVLDGKYAAYMHFSPTPVKTGLRIIDTGIVSGVPIWVAGDSDQDQDSVPDYLDKSPTLHNPDQ